MKFKFLKFLGKLFPIGEPEVEPVKPSEIIRPVVRKVSDMMMAGDFRKEHSDWACITWYFAFEENLPVALCNFVCSGGYYLYINNIEFPLNTSEYKLIEDVVFLLDTKEKARQKIVNDAAIAQAIIKIENYQVQDRNLIPDESETKKPAKRKK